MPYVTQQRIETAIPPQHLRDGLDDDGDGQADEGLLDEIIDSAGQAVDAMLAGLFAVPFDPVPAVVAEAAFVFACERVYERRQITERNPWREKADAWRERLEKIARGELKLDSTQDAAFVPGAAVTEAAKINGSMS